jgi:hypothetical protein
MIPVSGQLRSSALRACCWQLEASLDCGLLIFASSVTVDLCRLLSCSFVRGVDFFSYGHLFLRIFPPVVIARSTSHAHPTARSHQHPSTDLMDP